MLFAFRTLLIVKKIAVTERFSFEDEITVEDKSTFFPVTMKDYKYTLEIYTRVCCVYEMLGER